MERRYIILVGGVLAKTRKTLQFALKDKKELEMKGFKNVSIAYKLEKGDYNG